MKTFILASLLLTCSLVYGQIQQEHFEKKLCNAAVALTKNKVVYDPAYFSISYPDGDVPVNKGVCTDVIIRAYRTAGSIDLQKLIHEDMVKNFSKYPKKWKLKKADTNIDHRRVSNQMVFFSRFGKTKIISNNATDYLPGDIVAWDLGGGITHIGIAINQKSTDNKRVLIVHNIGNGQEISDCLFSFKIIGHYTYNGQAK